jgi:hypothetical protein
MNQTISFAVEIFCACTGVNSFCGLGCCGCVLSFWLYPSDNAADAIFMTGDLNALRIPPRLLPNPPIPLIPAIFLLAGS